MSNLKELYRVKQVPIFQNCVYETEHDAINCAKGDVVLVQDTYTGLINNKAFSPDLMRYNADYQNEQAFSSAFKKHLEHVGEIIHKYFFQNTLVEIGCGKGYFLDYLVQHGFDVIGVDPAYEGKNPNIIKKYFNDKLGISANGIILRHVLEHIQNPISFIKNIKDANGGGGKIYIEIPCFNWICQNRAWFDIYYEHVNYFLLKDFDRIFGTVYESGHIFNGQYLYVVADLASIRTSFSHFDTFKFPNDFSEQISLLARKIKKRNSQKQHEHDRQVVVWGGHQKE